MRLTRCLRPPWEEHPISVDARSEFLRALARALPGGWVARRRIVGEIKQHLEDCVAELEAEGLAEEVAAREAVARLGEVEAIADAFRVIRVKPPTSWRRLAGLRTAWVAVAAMSLVTAWAAELPQASGAKGTETSARFRPAQVSRHLTRTRGHRGSLAHRRLRGS